MELNKGGGRAFCPLRVPEPAISMVQILNILLAPLLLLSIYSIIKVPYNYIISFKVVCDDIITLT